MKSPVVLMILDGYGLREETEGNAIANADTPVMDEFFRARPWSRVKATGEVVGLPEGQIGNSEVGHMNIGAGRTVYQPLTRIDRAIEQGDFFENPELMEAVRYALEHDGTLHLMGLLSDGGVHSHQRHLKALLKLARRHDVDDVAVHAFLDGRDVPPRSAETYLKTLERYFEDVGVGRLATMGGRYYGMDRDTRWDRTEQAYRAIVEGTSGYQAREPLAALRKAYDERDEDDEFVQPVVFMDEQDQPCARVRDGDALIFFNFRPDRARQLTRAMTEQEFDKFSVDQPDIHFVCMAQYDEEFDLPVAFPPLELDHVLAEYLSDRGKSQYHIAETEKYAHVTFFFNGGREEPFPGEERKLIPSPRISTYDLKPEMSAYEVTDTLIDRLQTHDDDFVVVNFANPDMVGHTGDYEACVEAMEALDECIGRVWDAVREKKGQMLITADHGNAEQMVDPDTGSPHTAHTSNDCPVIYLNHRQVTLHEGSLPDIAPTVLDMMGLEQPGEMTGRSLLESATESGRSAHSASGE